MILDARVVKVLEQFEHAQIKAYLVGGVVRDFYLDKKTLDIDICFSGDYDLAARLFQDYQVNTSASKYRSFSFQINDLKFECSHMRVETGSLNHRHPESFEFVDDLNLDVLRRDFTINAMYYHLEDGFIDPLNGKQDLDDRLIVTCRDVKTSFNDDYLRLFRAFRFQSQLGFQLSEDILNVLDEFIPKLENYPITQWQNEFIQILRGPYFLEFAMSQADFFDVLFGDFKRAYTFDQRNPYHAYTLYEHTMRVVAEIDDKPLLKLAALFHDIGKLYTEHHDEFGVSHYRGHAEKSAQLALPIIEKFQFKKEDKQRVIDIIRNHGIRMKPGFTTSYHLAYIHGYDLMLDVIEIKRADNLSKSDKAFYQVEKCASFSLDMIRIKEENWPLKIKDLKVGAQNCLNLNVPQNKINKVLKYVLDRVVEDEVGNDAQLQYQYLQKGVHHVIH